MQDFRKLDVWNKSIKFVEDIYLLTKTFPKEEQYGLTSQIRRASVSVPANISEGCSRKTQADFAHFLRISLGSINEIETYLYITRNLKLIQIDEFTKLENQLQIIKIMILRLVERVAK